MRAFAAPCARQVRLPSPVDASLLLDRACIAPIHGDCHDWGGAMARLSSTGIRTDTRRTRNKHRPIHDRRARELRGPLSIPDQYVGAGDRSGRDLHPAAASARQTSGRPLPPLQADCALAQVPLAPPEPFGARWHIRPCRVRKRRRRQRSHGSKSHQRGRVE